MIHLIFNGSGIQEEEQAGGMKLKKEGLI